MSEITQVTQTNNQLHTTYDTTKFLLGFNSFITADLTAAGTDTVLKQGMIMGRIAATGLIVPLAAAAVDGSQYPVGVCVVDKTVGAGTTATITLVNKGRIASDLINFDGAETLATPVDDKQLRDWLNDLGLELEAGTELTKVDNS